MAWLTLTTASWAETCGSARRKAICESERAVSAELGRTAEQPGEREEEDHRPMSSARREPKNSVSERRPTARPGRRPWRDRGATRPRAPTATAHTSEASAAATNGRDEGFACMACSSVPISSRSSLAAAVGASSAGRGCSSGRPFSGAGSKAGRGRGIGADRTSGGRCRKDLPGPGAWTSGEGRRHRDDVRIRFGQARLGRGAVPFSASSIALKAACV